MECEGSGVRFFCEFNVSKSDINLSETLAALELSGLALLPGTIANGFRLKHAIDQTGGRDETTLPIKHAWEKLLLDPKEGGSHPENLSFLV